MTEYKTFDDYVRNVFKVEPTELTHISPEEQKRKTVKITADELINVWNELTELENENAELKSKNKWYSEQVCNKECAEVWGQIDKAKEILKRFLDAKSIEETCVAESEAEQFLNSEVEK